jgi:Haem-binding domain
MKQFAQTIAVLIIIGVVVFLLIQLVPYGRDHANPSVVSELKWDSPQTRMLAERACFDCHSNQTTWPWYSNIAPVSWLVYRDVVDGRRRMNFSDWQRLRLDEPGEIGSIIAEGEMPPLQYLLMHPSARLSAGEKEQLINGLTKTTSQ